MKPRLHPLAGGIGQERGEVGMAEGLAPVVEVQVEDVILRLIDDLLEKILVDVPFRFGSHLLVGAHDTTEVAEGAGFQPKA